LRWRPVWLVNFDCTAVFRRPARRSLPDFKIRHPVGTLYCEKFKLIAHDIDEADNLATLQQGGAGGALRISTSVAFGRRVVVPLALRYMALDLSFDDRYVNLIEQGVDLAIRMRPMADSSLGALPGHEPVADGRSSVVSQGARHAGQHGRPGSACLRGAQQSAGR
jgi:DNA-binding transcriptional LysR family regulator